MTPEERSDYIETVGKTIIFHRPKEASDHEVVEAVIVALQAITNMQTVAYIVDGFAPKASRGN